MKNPKLYRIILLISIPVLLLSCAQEEIAPITTSEEPSISYNIIETEINQLVNELRVSQGLNPLSPLNDISYEALTHSNYMVAVGTVSHDNFGTRYANLQFTINANHVAENVAYGYHSAASVVNAWTNSANHNGNLLGDFTHVGISVVEDEYNKFYVTQIYVNK